MQVKKFKDGLRKFEVFMKSVSCEAPSLQVAQLISMFSGQDDKTIASFTNLVKKNWKANGRKAAHPKELKNILKQIEAIYRTTGPVGYANDCKKLQELFTGNQEQEISFFIDEVKEGLIVAPKAPKKKTKRKEVTQQEQRQFADRLVAAMNDNDSFDTLLKELEKPRNFVNAEIFGIASYFLGYDSKFKSKKAAIEAIKNRRLQDAIGKSQLRGIARVGA